MPQALMAELSPDIADDVIAACQAGAEEAAGALSRALAGEGESETALTMTVGEAAAFDPEALPEGLAGPGLAIVMIFGDAGAVAVLPAASGLLPDWLRAPDATGESQLSTLAQELSMLLVPETLFADDFQAAWVDDLPAALARGGVAAGAGLAPLTLSGGDKSGGLTLVWPAATPRAVIAAPPAEGDAAEADAEATAPQADPSADTAPTHAASAQGGPPPARRRAPITDMAELPNYARSLLRVEVPVSVCLATKKQSIGEIAQLGPGAIITFEKSCDDRIQLLIGNEPIAQGEAVKVGEKFGLQVTEMILPDEDFKTVRRDAG
ncbi:MAG: FliM/FliN family flagellar motor C-terminal domain-containing protein [Planctomycetota bacterium]